MKELTKTDFVHYLKCPKSLWLIKNKPDVYPYKKFSKFFQSITQQGYEVEKYAEKLFSGGKNIPSGSVEKTKELLNKEEVLFQPTFISSRGLHTRVDILKRNGNMFDIYEVKSSTKINTKKWANHIKDVCFQKIVLTDCGLNIDNMYIIFLNKEYVLEDKIVPKKLLNIECVTQKICDIEEETRLEIDNAVSLINTDKIDETHCPCFRKTRSNHCDSFYYFNNVAEKGTIYDFNNIREKKLNKILDTGILNIKDVVGIELNEKNILQQKAVLTGDVLIDKKEIKKKFDKLKYPLQFLDYETASSAIPCVIGTKPWQQLPFQFSLHILYKDGKLEHKEFLSRKLDSVEDFIKVLKNSVLLEGDFVSWHASFEKTRNREMSETHMEYGDFLFNINKRMFDLEDIFKLDYIDSRFNGYTSIKKVLPVICPNLSYDDLEVHDGTEAMEKWFSMLESKDEDSYSHLIEYCKLDTFAMVCIFKEIYKRL